MDLVDKWYQPPLPLVLFCILAIYWNHVDTLLIFSKLYFKQLLNLNTIKTLENDLKPGIQKCDYQLARSRTILPKKAEAKKNQ